MEVLGTTLLLAAAGTWIGAIVFQSAIVAPTVFSGLNEAASRAFLRKLFPRFFRLGLVCGGLMLLGLSLVGFGGRLSGFVTALTAVMLLLEAVSLRMVPAINAARDAGADGEGLFETLHRASVLMTVVILLLGIGIFALVATARPFGLSG